MRFRLVIKEIKNKHRKCNLCDKKADYRMILRNKKHCLKIYACDDCLYNTMKEEIEKNEINIIKH